MTVELTATVGEQRREYALKQGRTDLDPAEVAEAQIALVEVFS
jgi:hypothetical protein